jgi:hypothetical protein
VHRTPTAAQLIEEFHHAMAGVEVASKVPAESFVATVTDSSVAMREQAPNYDELVLRLPKGSGKKLRRAADKARKQFQKVAYHAGVEARNAAKQARREARKAVRFARKHGYWDTRAAMNGHAGHNGQQPYGSATHAFDPAAEAHGTGLHRVLWWIVGGFCLLLFLLKGPSALAGIMKLGILGALGYGAYRLVRHLSGPEIGSSMGASPIVETRPPVAAPARPVVVPVSAPVATPVRVRHTYRAMHLRVFNPATPRRVAQRARMTDLTGSMTLAAFLTALVTAGALLLGGPTFRSNALAGLFGLTTLLGSWALIALAKLFEGRKLDTGAMRLMQLAAGVAVGMSAFWIDSALLTELPTDHSMVEAIFSDVGPYHLVSTRHTLYEPASAPYQPSLAGYMVFFGALFGVRRWWWMSDSFRKRRFRVMSVVWTAGLALALTFIWAFPKEWAMMWAVAISCVVQLASGWTRPEDRLPLVEEETSHAA